MATESLKTLSRVVKTKDSHELLRTFTVLYKAHLEQAREARRVHNLKDNDRTVSYKTQRALIEQVRQGTQQAMFEVLLHIITRAVRHKYWRYLPTDTHGTYFIRTLTKGGSDYHQAFPLALKGNYVHGSIVLPIYEGLAEGNPITMLTLEW